MNNHTLPLFYALLFKLTLNNLKLRFNQNLALFKAT